MKNLKLFLILFFATNAFSQGSGNSLQFNGTTSYVEIPHNAIFNTYITSNVMTIEAWVKVNAINTDAHGQTRQPVIAKGSPTAGQKWQWALYINDNLSVGSSFWRDCGGSSHNEVSSAPNTIKLNEWTHVAMVYSKGNYNRVYINGVLSAEKTIFSGALCDNAAPIRIANRIDGQYLNAEIDEIRIWNEAKTETDLRNNMCKKALGTETNLLAAWNFDEGTGTVLNDLTANNLNGTLVNVNTATDWKISGAAIGDESSYNYPNSWAGQSVSLNSTNDGNLTIDNITGSPNGLHIYKVNTLPNTSAGIKNLPNNDTYYGVFVVGGAGTDYNINYDYSNNTDAINDEFNLNLYGRFDNSIQSWNTLNSTTNTTNNTILKTVNTSRNQEIILGRLNDISGYLGPGGVGNPNGATNLVLWMNPDKGINTNTSFKDQSGYGYDFNGGNGATLNTADINGYNSYSYNGTSSYFSHPFEAKLNPPKLSIFSVTNTTSSSNYKTVFSSRENGVGTARRGIILYARQNTNYWSFWNGSTNAWEYLETNHDSSGQWENQSCIYQETINGKEIYVDGTLLNQASHHLIQNTSKPFYIGAGANEAVAPDYYFKGKMGELIMYDDIVNKTQNIIISNYLAAKYNTTLTTNDFYTQDNPANGNFDHNVAGIGQATDGSNHTDSQGTGVIRINSPSSLNNDEYLFWGENVKDATYEFATINNTTERLNTIWRVSKQNDLGTVSISFKDTDINISSIHKDCGALKLVVASDETITTIINSYDLVLNAGVYTASNVLLSDTNYFTIEFKTPETVWNGTTWSNGIPNISTKSTFTADYDMNTQASVTACNCELTATKTITIPDGKFLEVKYEIANNGTITTDHGGSIVQIDNTNNNIGVDYNIKKTANQTGAYDVTYFSTPTATTSVNDMVPNTIYHYDFDASVQNWNYNLDPAVNMTIGRGYILRNPVVAGDYTVNFTGEINNGIYTSPVLITGAGAAGDDDWNLLGNPYPSAIDADVLFAENNAVIKGAVYYWQHLTILNPAHDDYVDGGYTVYNGAGGTAIVGGTIGNIAATQYIPSGVGFFVEATANGNVTFSNTQRVTDNNSTVFRIADNANRVWLNIIENSTNKGRQQLIGFFNEATDGVDNLYDAHALDSGLSFYSLLNNEKYSIQSKDNNYEDEIIPLGYNAPQDGTFTISIDHTTGTIAAGGNYIYLKDNELNIVHDLTDSDYTFSSVLGENNTRFELFATQQALDVRDEVYTNDDSLFVNQNNNNFELSTATNATIKQVTVYDVVGRKLITVSNNTVQLNVQKGQVLIFEVLLENGSKMSKKIIKM